MTLVELAITVLLMSVLSGVMVFVFITLTGQWSSGEKRASVDIGMDRGMEEMVRDLREANQALSSNDEMRYTRDGSNYSIYYFYNNQVRKAVLTGGLSGTYTNSTGRIVIRNVVMPAVSNLSLSNNTINIDISISRGNETVRQYTAVRPRNL